MMTRVALATSAAEPMTVAIMTVSPIVGVLLGPDGDAVGE
jgi:hypothetical protein